MRAAQGFERIVRAQTRFVLRPAPPGGSTKIFARLGVVPRPVGLYGPPMISLLTSGVPAGNVESLHARAVQAEIDRIRHRRNGAAAPAGAAPPPRLALRSRP